MKKVIGEDFLLSNETAKMLYHEYAEPAAIIDYHCHISPRQIAVDKKFKNITELWLDGDHYKWRLMRSNGIAEKYITGNAPDFEKFQKWAKSLERAIGNPLYHWSHLELKRYFGYEGELNAETAAEVWELCNRKIQTAGLSARTLIQQSNVAVIGTTDDPVDDLQWHDRIAADDSFDTRVLPMWRPDRAMEIENPDYLSYIAQLSAASEIAIGCYRDFKRALQNRLEYFAARGCRGSDHGLKDIPYEPVTESEIETIFTRRLSGQAVSTTAARQFKTACLLFLGKEYAKRSWVMQLHIGVTRNNNRRMFEALGADTGFDGIYNRVSMEQLSQYLNALDEERLLPRTVIYSLNPNDNAVIGALIGCFQEHGIGGKLQHGAAWWFNDHEMGMREQMISLANLGVLGNFIGMLTDSRSLLSYTRHEYFRRCLCDLIGTWIETGRCFADSKRVGRLIEDICGNNARNYFNFPTRERK